MAALLLLRVVDLHWHQHMIPPCGSMSCAGEPIQYLADASIPHLSQDQDIDVPVVGKLLLADLALDLPALIAILLALLPLLLWLAPASGGFRLRQRRSRPPPLAAPPQNLRPPLRAPPLLTR